MIIEEYRGVVGYPNYEVSNLGNVRNVKTKKVLKQNSEIGYYRISLRNNGRSKNFLVHRLVAIAFLPSTKEQTQVNHKNGNRLDNRLENLEWCTAKENAQHREQMKKKINKER